MNRRRAVKVLSVALACCMSIASAAKEPKNSKTVPPADAKRTQLAHLFKSDKSPEGVTTDGPQVRLSLFRI
jgi:hypothetical protein